MTSVLIRNVEETLHARLKARAAAHRRSLEEEARELLRAAIAREATPAREHLAALAPPPVRVRVWRRSRYPTARRGPAEHAARLLQP